MLTVGQLAAQAGVPASTLRYYDRIGLLPAARNSSRYRMYDTSSVSLLRAIDVCRTLGMELAEIRRILDLPAGPAAARRDLARHQLQRLQIQLAQLNRARAMLEHLVDCVCLDVGECLTALEDAGAGVP